MFEKLLRARLYIRPPSPSGIGRSLQLDIERICSHRTAHSSRMHSPNAFVHYMRVRRIRRRVSFVRGHTSTRQMRPKIENRERHPRSSARSFTRVHASNTLGLRDDSWLFFAGLPIAFEFATRRTRFRWVSLLSQMSALSRARVYAVRASKQIAAIRGDSPETICMLLKVTLFSLFHFPPRRLRRIV